jgi:hypothetical protein
MNETTGDVLAPPPCPTCGSVFATQAEWSAHVSGTGGCKPKPLALGDYVFPVRLDPGLQPGEIRFDPSPPSVIEGGRVITSPSASWPGCPLCNGPRFFIPLPSGATIGRAFVDGKPAVKGPGDAIFAHTEACRWPAFMRAGRRLKAQRRELRRLQATLKAKRFEAFGKKALAELPALRSLRSSLEHLLGSEPWHAGMYHGMKLARDLVANAGHVASAELLNVSIGWRFEGKTKPPEGGSKP